MKVRARLLKPGTIPSQWPGQGVPKYLSSSFNSASRNQSHATAASRHLMQVERGELEFQTFLDAERVTCFEDVITKLKTIILPDGISIIQKPNCVIFIYIEEQGHGQISILFHLSIFQDCSFKMEVRNVAIEKSSISIVTKKETIEYLWEISNILAILKNLAETFFDQDQSLERVVRDFQTRMAQLTIEKPETEKKIGFLLEQLSLAVLPKMHRKYSSDLLACSAMWRSTSPALYKQILAEGYLTIPCTSWLKTLTSSLTMSFGLTQSAVQYLRLRIKNLTPRERKVILAFDEIYVNQKVDFAGGRIFGLMTENNSDEDPTKKPCKTVLCFHISSLFGQFQDMVAQYPIVNLDSSVLKQCFDSVMSALHEIGFEVMIISADNATPNRKFLTELCEGTLRESIPHPHLPGQQLVVLFDTVHGFKNVYNNFQSRERFVCSSFDDFTKTIFPTFKHVRDLFELEHGKPVKMAYKLSKKAMSPRSIEKTNVMLAQSVFDESTLCAMEFYIKNLNKPWQDTLSFLKIINKWWKIVNTKNAFFHQKSRDSFRAPIRSTADESFLFLSQFAEWISFWDSKLEGHGKDRPGLTPPTMTAMLLSTKAVQSFAKDMILNQGFEYVLLGKCQSDKLEARFGWYRQMSGGNYFISCRQILESDKLIKVRSLVKYSSLELRDIKKVFGPISSSEKECVETAALELASMVEFQPLNQLQSLEDDNIVFYVAGYLARSISRKIQCTSCKDLVSLGKVPLIPIFEDIEDASLLSTRENFLQQVNRGGLSKPSDLVYLTCIHAWGIFSQILDNLMSKKFLLQTSHPREVFAEAFCQIVASSPETAPIMEVTCDKGHAFKPLGEELANRIFNVFGKNFASERNSEIHASKKRSQSASSRTSSEAKKINKLQSIS